MQEILKFKHISGKGILKNAYISCKNWIKNSTEKLSKATKKYIYGEEISLKDIGSITYEQFKIAKSLRNTYFAVQIRDKKVSVWETKPIMTEGDIEYSLKNISKLKTGSVQIKWRDKDTGYEWSTIIRAREGYFTIGKESD